MKSNHLVPKIFTRAHTSMTAQNVRTVCQAFGTKSSFHKVMALKINCAPEKLTMRD